MKKLCLLTLMVFFYACKSNLKNTNTQQYNNKIQFSLKDVNGKTYTEKDLIGKYTIIEAVNFTCPYTKKHYKSNNMQNLQQKYTKKGIIWLSVCSSGTGKKGHFSQKIIKKLLKKYNAKPTAYLIDEKGTLGKSLGLIRTPQIVILSPEGIVLYNGAIDDIKSTKLEDIQYALNYVDANFRKLLKQKKVIFSETTPYGCLIKY